MKNKQRFLNEDLISASSAPQALGYIARRQSSAFPQPNQQAFVPVQFFSPRRIARSEDWKKRIAPMEELHLSAAWEELAYFLLELCGIGAIALAFAV